MVNNSGAAKVEYLTKKKQIKNIKIQLPAISMHVRLPQSLISMSIQKLYTNRSSFAQSARFSRPGCFTFHLTKKKVGTISLKTFQ